MTPKPDPRAFNAYRHGLTGHVLVVPPAEQAAYDQHCRGIHRALAPQGEMEANLVQAIADDRWRLQRAAAIEANIFALGVNRYGHVATGNEESDTALAMARVWLERGKDLDRLSLYEGRLQRKVEKNLNLLRQLQKDRREAAAKLPEIQQPHAPSRDSEFVFSRPAAPRPVVHSELICHPAASGPSSPFSPR